MWNNPVSLAAFVSALAALVTAITALWSSFKAHSVVNKEIRPQQVINTEDIKELKENGNGNDKQHE